MLVLVLLLGHPQNLEQYCIANSLPLVDGYVPASEQICLNLTSDNACRAASFPPASAPVEHEQLADTPGCLKDRKDVFWVMDAANRVVMKKDLFLIKTFFAEENFALLVDPLEKDTLLGVQLKPLRLAEVSGLETGLVSSVWVKDKEKTSTHSSLMPVVDEEDDQPPVRTASEFFDRLIQDEKKKESLRGSLQDSHKDKKQQTRLEVFQKSKSKKGKKKTPSKQHRSHSANKPAGKSRARRDLERLSTTGNRLSFTLDDLSQKCTPQKASELRPAAHKRTTSAYSSSKNISKQRASEDLASKHLSVGEELRRYYMDRRRSACSDGKRA